MIENGKFAWPVAKTLFHELGHIIDENQREGVKTKERLQKPLIGQFYEWTNTIFERLANGDSFYKKKDAMQVSDSGYRALAPLGSMVSCALGIPEVEFAQIKDKGKDYENKLLESLFPKEEKNDVLNRVKDIFNVYNLNTDFSWNKKKNNQNLINELYSECLKIMKKRIENELQSGDIENLEEYRKHQMFYLKKMNFNFKVASKSEGFIFLRGPITHDIGFCNDQISRDDLMQIADEHIAMTEFGFDNSTLEKYSKAMVANNDRKSFIKILRTSIPTLQTPTLIQSSKEGQTHEDDNVK